MRTSTRIPQCAIELIKRFEGYHEELPDGRARAYPDRLRGRDLPTIGYGTTRYPEGGKVREGDIITRERAEECLRWYLENVCTQALDKIPTWKRMNENQRGALYSFAYNLGAHFHGAVNRESITKVCDSPDLWDDPEWIEKQFVKYRNPGTSVEAGLRLRRKAEAELFCSPAG